MDYAAQLAFKQVVLADWLDRQEGLQPGTWLEPLTAGPAAYRRKARLSVRDVPAKGRVLVGFREQDRRFVAELDACPVLDPRLSDALPGLSALIGTLSVRDAIPQLEAACGDDRCALILRHLAPLTDEDQVQLSNWAQDHDFDIWLQPGGPATVSLLSGQEWLHYGLPEWDLSFRFGPMDFVQVNAGLNRLMIGQALAQLAPGAGDRVLDLFCGLGNFTLPLAQHCDSVLGLEGDAALVARAADNAEHNGIANARFEVADLYAEGLSWPEGRFDRVLLDPPRSGAISVLGRIAESGASRVVYVSCNPETLARDAGLLVREHGFHLESAGVMDMFPQTAHVEAMAVFTR
jgi:23S rRNA (uracil1939-C5)-methyltransferase